jgi:ribosomal-protein-alanine acetyltransferase
MAATTLARVAIRDMTLADLRQVRRIERAAYGRSAPGTPFERELAMDLAQYIVAVEVEEARTSGGGAPARERSLWDHARRLLGLGRDKERIVGFAGVWFTQDQVHIVTIAVDPAAQHRGIAQRLLLECHALAMGAEAKTMALEVRVSNERARSLYEWFGFARAGMLRGYYADNGEDAIVMLTPELDTPDFAAHIETLRAEQAKPSPPAPSPRNRGEGEPRRTRNQPGGRTDS